METANVIQFRAGTEHGGHGVNYRAYIHETMQETGLLGDNYSRR